eukprot:COSAG01_NODE_27597_length_681_cov_3.237113_1_plen_222_part_10
MWIGGRKPDSDLSSGRWSWSDSPSTNMQQQPRLHSKKNECAAHEDYVGMYSSVRDCANACVSRAKFFIYSTHYRTATWPGYCRGSLCRCSCEARAGSNCRLSPHPAYNTYSITNAWIKWDRYPSNTNPSNPCLFGRTSGPGAVLHGHTVTKAGAGAVWKFDGCGYKYPFICEFHPPPPPSPWVAASATVSRSAVQLRFKGTQGSDWRGDICRRAVTPAPSS